MENPAFIGVSLSDVRVIMTIMHVHVVELACQAVMERIPVLKCLFPRHAWVPVAMSCLAWH
jgi:hypothetical protein